MKALLLFVHSVRLVMNNLESALRISALLYLVQAVSQLYFFASTETAADTTGTQIPALSIQDSIVGLLLGVLSLLAGLWIAVTWHRFVLKEEYPNGWFPQWHGPNMLGYLGRSILISLLIVIACIVVSIPLGIIGAGIPALMPAIPVVLIGFGAWIFFRLCTALPAAAIGETVSLKTAWESTKPHAVTMVHMAIIFVAFLLLTMALSFILAQISGPLNLLFDLVIGWVVTMVGISVLTSVYGHVVEGRDID